MIGWLIIAAYLVGAGFAFRYALDSFDRMLEPEGLWDTAAEIYFGVVVAIIWPIFGLLLLAARARIRSRSRR